MGDHGFGHKSGEERVVNERDFTELRINMHILGSPISRVKQLIVKLKAEKVFIPNKWNSPWATVLRSKLWTMYNLTHVKVHFSILQTLSEHLLYPNVPTLQTQPRQVGTRGCLLAAPHLWKHNALKTLLCMTSSSWEKERSLEVIISFSLNPVFCLPQFQLAYLCILWGPLERKKCPGLDIARGITF